jgi:hypothetical protein
MRKKKDDVAAKALERLVLALVSSPDTELTRTDMIEEALNYSALALGMSLPNVTALQEQLTTVAVEVLSDRAILSDARAYVVNVTCAEDQHLATVVATGDDDIADEIKRVVDRHQARKQPPRPAVDYSIN